MSYKFGDLYLAHRKKINDFDWSDRDEIQFLDEDLVIEEPSPDIIHTRVTWCGPE